MLSSSSSPGKSSRPSCQLEQLLQRLAYCWLITSVIQRLEASYLNADVFLAVFASNSRLDDLVVRDKHVHMRDRKQCEADTEEVEEVLDEHTESRMRKVINIDGLKTFGFTNPYARMSAPSSLACLMVLYPSPLT